MQNTYFFLSFLLFILPYFRERTGILVWRAAVLCVCSLAFVRTGSLLGIIFLFTAFLYLEGHIYLEACLEGSSRV